MLSRCAQRAERIAAGPPGGAAYVEGAPDGLCDARFATVRHRAVRSELRRQLPPPNHRIPDRDITVQDPRELEVVVIVVVPNQRLEAVATGEGSGGGREVKRDTGSNAHGDAARARAATTDSNTSTAVRRATPWAPPSQTHTRTGRACSVKP